MDSASKSYSDHAPISCRVSRRKVDVQSLPISFSMYSIPEYGTELDEILKYVNLDLMQALEALRIAKLALSEADVRTV